MKSIFNFTILALAFFSSLQSSNVNAQTWAETFTTSFGNIYVGPIDGNSGHIYTDRPKFLFNKDLYSATGGFSSISGIGLSLKTNGTTRMFIHPTSGNIGINTISPLSALHVVGDIFVPSDYAVKFGADNPNSGVLIIRKVTSISGTFMDFMGNVNFRRFDPVLGNVGSSLVLQKDGTITMGVAERYDGTAVNTQGYKLMVNGGILCEKVKVIADVPNSDHVFKTDYKLMSLEELKAYVNQNQHLPEIPSAQEFAENGYSIGEMDDLLLRKVEELTLYIIQLQEQVKLQQQLIDEMKQK